MENFFHHYLKSEVYGGIDEDFNDVWVCLVIRIDVSIIPYV